MTTSRRVLWLGMLLVVGPAVAIAQQFDGLGSLGPQSDAKLGEIYFSRGVEAVRHKDYKFAVEMYEAAASWAYKPAEYNLAVMYMRGEGIPIDRPRALAWAALAAERNDKRYVEAREVIYADLGKDEFEQANAVYRDLKPKFGDDTALRRANSKWVETRNAATGSLLGFTGNLAVGQDDPGRFGFQVPTEKQAQAARAPVRKGPADGFAIGAFGFTGGEQVDGSVAYRALREASGPYDPKLTAGQVLVGPLEPGEEKKPEVSDKEPQH